MTEPNDEVSRRATALLVPVHAATPVVGEHRRRLDKSAAVGVPEHITLMYPFLPPDQITEDVRVSLAELFAPVRSFEFSLAAARWFGEAVLWLEPVPGDAFVKLTTEISERFGIQQYGGDYDDVTPHLTIGYGPSPALTEAEAQIVPHLPIRTTADRIWLMTGDDQRWELVQEFVLRP